jgi:hypothetical protein
LAEIFERRFPDTPVIRNEQVVRRRVTAVSKSARKRCILAVIQGSAGMGINQFVKFPGQRFAWSAV